MAEDDELHPGTAQLSDVPSGLKKILTWCWVYYSDRPLWQKPILGSIIFVLGVIASPTLSQLLDLVKFLLTVLVGGATFSMNQAILGLLGLIFGTQY